MSIFNIAINILIVGSLLILLYFAIIFIGIFLVTIFEYLRGKALYKTEGVMMKQQFMYGCIIAFALLSFVVICAFFSGCAMPERRIDTEYGQSNKDAISMIEVSEFGYREQ